MPPPVVIGDLLQQRGWIGDEFRVEKRTALEGSVAQLPLAETMEDNRAVLKAVKDTGKIVQIGSQRRSGVNYKAAADFIKEGKFGSIVMVELMWNVNQPGRWRRPGPG